MSYNKMQGWTIYDHPRDYPDCFVARRWITKGYDVIATADTFTAATLDEVRALLPPGLIVFPRCSNDDPVIVEVWL
jgi:hypothetical protein